MAFRLGSKKLFTEILVKPVTLNGLKATYALIFKV